MAISMQHSIRIILITGVFALAGLLGLAHTSDAQTASSVLNITVKEWKVLLDKAEVSAGDLVVTVNNQGEEIHELVIIRLIDSKTLIEELPVNKHGAIDEEKMEFGTIVGEIEDLEPHKVSTSRFKLQPGRYAIVCNMLEQEPDGSMESHYSMGMHALLNVR